ncbi:DUF6355 family natural product biosynthesis protein [Streptomyces mauvecolor]
MRTRRIASTLASLALLGGATVATTAPAHAAACGYFVSYGNSYYNHCTHDGSIIDIHIDVVLGWDKNRCVSPGVTYLGPATKIRNAWYTGKLC